jgi:hypothetical protein
MQGTINVKSPNNTSKWQMGFNSEFKGLMAMEALQYYLHEDIRQQTEYSSIPNFFISPKIILEK